MKYLLILIINKKKLVFFILVFFALIFGLIGFYKSQYTIGFLDIINNTIGLFAFSYPDADDNAFLDISKLLASLSVFYGAIILFFLKWTNHLLIRFVQDQSYELIIGLSKQSCLLIQNDNNSLSKIIIESNLEYSDIQKFNEKGFGVITQNAKEVIKTLNLQNLQNAIISTGNDHQNITLTAQISELISAAKKPKIFLRVDNRDLSTLFKQEVLSNSRSTDIIPFSLNENISKLLFSQHSILGLQKDIIDNRKGYRIILVGCSDLCIELIYQLAVLAHLPNQNALTIHCVNEEAELFCSKLEKLFTGIKEIPNLNIKPHTLDSNSINFYKDALWKLENLTNIIIATDDEDTNLDIAVNLQDTTFIKETTEGSLKTKVLFALFNDAGLGNKIDQNKDTFANFYCFGKHAEVSTRDNLINEKLDSIAKLINYDYDMTKTRSKQVSKIDIQKSWMHASLNDRESCKSQAAHIDVKLLALGLQKIQSDKSLITLLEKNRTIFNKRLVDRDISDEMLTNYKAEYFPNTFKNQINKLGRAEHNRWNAFHYLRGWQYDEIKNKKAKRHDCLLTLEKFHTDETKETYQYDLLSIVKIPNYLAYAGYEIVKKPCKTIS